MTLESFKESLSAAVPPDAASPYLKALWHDAKGDWHKAHELIQDINDEKAAWIHAYLHRKEGDFSNARYWYTRAGKSVPPHSLQREWEEIVGAML